MVMVSNPPDVCRIRDGPFSTFCLFGVAVTSERAHTRLAPIHPYFVPRHPPSSAIPPPLPLAPCPKHHHSGFDSGVLPPSEHDGSGLEAVPSCPHSISVPVLPKFQLHSPTSFPPNPLIFYSILGLFDPPNPMVMFSKPLHHVRIRYRPFSRFQGFKLAQTSEREVRSL
ncbi:hypothetical protein D9758_005297 [Tetrapyrgos nigripes]|uniref:Uncharacterized protein n=1 Tax=Tetrapyrgos nigripes TaxID=182062 RepID=A0A8H5LWF8_9AGAR|nr:hypothetical protein D9758_005297 [Tetrapyrgos nigripes]